MPNETLTTGTKSASRISANAVQTAEMPNEAILPAKMDREKNLAKDEERLRKECIEKILMLSKASSDKRDDLLLEVACKGWRLVFSEAVEENDLQKALRDALEANGELADGEKAKASKTIGFARNEIQKALGIEDADERIGSYCLGPNGLKRFRFENGSQRGIFISDGFRILGVGSVDGSNDWGLVVELQESDVEGRPIRWIFKNSSLISRNTSYLEDLHSKGFSVEKSKTEEFIAFLQKAFRMHRDLVKKGVEEPMLFPNKTGWLEDKPYYVMPNEVIPPNPKIIPNIDERKTVYSRKGSLDKWKWVAECAVKNPPYTFAVCVGLAGVLLPFSGIDTGTFFHPTNDSTAGKTLMAHIAGSLWGPFSEQKSSWDNTDNHFASLGCSRNHNLVILDEIGNVKPKKAGKIVYLLANGQGRGKNDVNDRAKEVKHWLCFILTTGEITLVAVQKKAGESGTTGGQDVRFIPIRIDESLYGSTCGFASGQDLAREIAIVTDENYGWAGPIFVQYVAEHYEEIKKYVRREMAKVIDTLIPAGCHSQIRRSAQSFALCEMAGKIAQKCGILPEEIDVHEVVKMMCGRWLANRPSHSQSGEAVKIVQNIIHNLNAFGDFKFPEIEKGKRIDQFKYQEIWGYREKVKDSQGGFAWHYYVNRENILPISGYESLDAVAEALDKAGMLYCPPAKRDKPSRQKEVQKKPEGCSDRFYEIVLPDDADDEDKPAEKGSFNPETGVVYEAAEPASAEEGTAKAS